MIMKPMTVLEIMEEYRNGERDFTNISCRCGQFNDLILDEADFSSSDLGYCGFRHCKLNGCKFVGANVEWSKFNDAELREADFTDAKADYCSFNDAKMDGAVLTDADMSYSLFLNVVMNFKDMNGTNFHRAAFCEDDLSKDGVDHVRMQLM